MKSKPEPSFEAVHESFRQQTSRRKLLHLAPSLSQSLEQVRKLGLMARRLYSRPKVVYKTSELGILKYLRKPIAQILDIRRRVLRKQPLEASLTLMVRSLMADHNEGFFEIRWAHTQNSSLPPACP